MKKTALALFRNQSQINRAVRELEGLRPSPPALQTFDDIGDTRLTVQIATIETNDDRFGDSQSELFRSLRSWGVPWYDAGLFTEGVRHGGKLLAVFAQQDELPSIIRILKRHGALDLEMRRQFVEDLRQRPSTGESSSPFTKIARESRFSHDFADWLCEHRDRMGPRDPVKIYEAPLKEDLGLDHNLNE